MMLTFALFAVGGVLGAGTAIAQSGDDGSPNIFAGDPLPPSTDVERDLTAHLIEESFQLLRRSSFLKSADQSCGDNDPCQKYASPEAFLVKILQRCDELTFAELREDATKYEIASTLKDGIIKSCDVLTQAREAAGSNLSAKDLVALGRQFVQVLGPVNVQSREAFASKFGVSEHD
jgi:hypothetical protein